MRSRLVLTTLLLPLLAACSSDPSTVGDGTVPEPSLPPSASAPATTPGTTAATDATLVTVTFANGAVTPRGYTAKVKLGTKVHLVIKADVSDEVHVHDYDLKADVTNGQAVIDFTASIPGIFEIELESRSYTLLHLEVS